MINVLRLLINAFEDNTTSAEYQVVLTRFCEIEKMFSVSLDEKQQEAYKILDSVRCELSVALQKDFAEFLYKHLKEIFK